MTTEEAMGWCLAEAERASGYRIDKFRAVAKLLREYRDAATDHGLLCPDCGRPDPWHSKGCLAFAVQLAWIRSVSSTDAGNG